MKKTLISVFFLLVLSSICVGQVITTNRNPVGLEHNLLFNATTRYTVTQTGAALLTLPMLFDGRFEPSYTDAGVVASNPTVIIIEGLPDAHAQAGVIVGWSTRWWPTSHFKIEAYNVYAGANQWVTVADYSSTVYSGYDFNTWLRDGSFTKLRFTFFTATGDGGRLGVSELFFLHPEATSPYAGLFTSASVVYSNGNGNVGIGTANPSAKFSVGSGSQIQLVDNPAGWGSYGQVPNIVITDTIDNPLSNSGWSYKQLSFNQQNGQEVWTMGWKQGGLRFDVNNGTATPLFLAQAGNVGIGTTTPTEKLSVKGRIRAQEVVVDNNNWSDYVFAKNYKLVPLSEVEQHIQTQGHLPGVPSAREIAEKGVSLGDIQAILLAKIEELTLHQIAQEKRLQAVETENARLKAQLK